MAGIHYAFTIDDAEAWLCDIDGSWNPIEL